MDDQESAKVTDDSEIKDMLVEREVPSSLVIDFAYKANEMSSELGFAASNPAIAEKLASELREQIVKNQDEIAKEDHKIFKSRAPKDIKEVTNGDLMVVKSKPKPLYFHKLREASKINLQGDIKLKKVRFRDVKRTKMDEYANFLVNRKDNLLRNNNFYLEAAKLKEVERRKYLAESLESAKSKLPPKNFNVYYNSIPEYILYKLPD